MLQHPSVLKDDECGVQAAPIALRCAKRAINEGLETDILSGMRVEEAQYAKVGFAELPDASGPGVAAQGCIAYYRLMQMREVVSCCVSGDFKLPANDAHTDCMKQDCNIVYFMC